MDNVLHNMLERTVRLTGFVLDLPFVHVQLLSESRKLRCRITFYQDRRFLQTSFSNRIASSGKLLVINDTHQDALTETGALPVHVPFVHACMGMPLLWGDAVIGTFVGYDTEPRLFTQREINTFSDFTRLVNEAIVAAPAADEKSDMPRLTEAITSSNSEVPLLARPLPRAVVSLDEVIFRQPVPEALNQNAVSRLTEKQLCDIADQMPAMIGYWNKNLRCEFANEAYRGWFGLAPKSIVGLHMSQLFDGEAYKSLEPFAQAALLGQAQRFERRVFQADGTLSYVEVHYVVDKDAQGDVRGFYVLVSEVTDLRLAQEELQRLNERLLVQSATDHLTGLSNRRIFNETIQQLHRRHIEERAPYGLILIDLDNFKSINDSYGHLIGDEVLVTIGRLLSITKEIGHLAARLGGEEFGVLSEQMGSEDQLCQFAESIRAAINATKIESEGRRVRFTASFGVSGTSGRQRIGDWSELFKKADAALFSAKASGKNRVVRASALVTPIHRPNLLKNGRGF